MKRRLLADHFFDTVLLLAFEGGIVFAFAFLGRFVQMEAELISWVHLVTTWTCISTLMLFSIQFLVLFAITSLNDIKETAVQHDGNRTTPEDRV